MHAPTTCSLVRPVTAWLALRCGYPYSRVQAVASRRGRRVFVIWSGFGGILPARPEHFDGRLHVHCEAAGPIMHGPQPARTRIDPMYMYSCGAGRRHKQPARIFRYTREQSYRPNRKELVAVFLRIRRPGRCHWETRKPHRATWPQWPRQ